MSGGLLVTHQHEAELRIVLDGIVDGQNRTARNAEDVLDARSSSERTSASAPVIFSPSTMVCFSVVADAFGMPLNACRGVGNTMFPLMLVRGKFPRKGPRSRRSCAVLPLKRMLCNRLWRIAAAFLSDNESMLTADSLVRRKGPYSGALRAMVIWTIFFAIATLPCNAVS